MKAIRLLLLSLLTVSTLAFAQEESDSPPATSDTSADSWNVRTFPLGLALGLANVRLDYKIAPQWVIGPKLYFWNFNLGDVKINAFGIGANGAYYFKPLWQNSWYVDFGGQYASLKLDSKNGADRVETSSVTNFSISVLGGYHWFWNRFNLNVGLGLASNSAGKLQVKDSQGNVVREESMPAVGLAGDASLGWTF